MAKREPVRATICSSTASSPPSPSRRAAWQRSTTWDEPVELMGGAVERGDRKKRGRALRFGGPAIADEVGIAEPHGAGEALGVDQIELHLDAHVGVAVIGPFHSHGAVAGWTLRRG